MHLRKLIDQKKIRWKDIADRWGKSATTVRYHLDKHIDQAKQDEEVKTQREGSSFSPLHEEVIHEKAKIEEKDDSVATHIHHQESIGPYNAEGIFICYRETATSSKIAQRLEKIALLLALDDESEYDVSIEVREIKR